MPEECKICLTGPSEWVADDLEGHVRAEHGDNEASVRAMYDDRFEHLFEDGRPDPVESEPDPVPDVPEPTGSEEVFGKKWFVIGVGGAGNNILDAILMRRDTLLADDEERAQIWRGGLAGYGILNTNIAELEQTYYAREERGYDRRALLNNAIVGIGEHDYGGMGYRWQNGAKVAAADFEEEPDPFTARWDMSPTDIRDAQAIMLIHSVTKGTGCGATPVLADRLRNDVLSGDSLIDKPILSSVVIPSEGDEQSAFGGRAKTNGVVGLARIAQSVDALVPFNNQLLREASQDVTPRIDGLSRYNPPKFADLNKPLVAFIEAFTMSSIPQFSDRDATMSIRGRVFDVADSFRPVLDKYPANLPSDDQPGVVLAPALGRLRSGNVTESKLEVLVQKTLHQNRLADFDPSTAWGGNFMVYGPAEKMEDVSPFVTDGRLQELLSREEFLDASNPGTVDSVDVHLHQLVSPYLDDVYMWGTLWNPELPALSKMYDHAKRLKEESESRQANDIREIWGQVEALFEHLGRGD